MSRDRSFESLTGDERRVLAAAEQELTRLLEVEPGPAFAAKVRARIEDSRPLPRWPRWATAGLGLVMAMIALAETLADIESPEESPEDDSGSEDTQTGTTRSS